MGCGQQSLAGFNTAAAGGFDSDASAFFTAASITDATQQSAVNQLVLDLKSASIWTKMIALYPFVGAAATPHSFNLANPATFQITWSGTVTHNANGITPNGSTGFGDTGVNASTNMSLDDAHVSVYSRTNSTSTKVEIGVTDTVSKYSAIFSRYTDNKCYGSLWKSGASTSDEAGFTVSDSLGLSTISRRSSTDLELYRNGTSLGTLTSARQGTRPNFTYYIGGYNTAGTLGNASSRNIAFASLGTGLTDTDVSNLSTAVQAFQTTMGRQV